MSSDKFSEWLSTQLDRRSWSPAEFSRRLDANPGQVSNWLSGGRVPSPTSCDKIADVLGMEIDTVLVRAGHRPNVEDRSLHLEAERYCTIIHSLDLTIPARIKTLDAILGVYQDEDEDTRRSGHRANAG